MVPRPSVCESGPVPSRPAGAAQSQTVTKGAGPVGSRLHEGAAGGWSAFRPPDAALESEDEAIHLHRARRHLHHRPAADATAGAGGTRFRPQHRRARRHDPVRRHEEAGPGRGPRRGRPGRDAVRRQPLARRPADELAHDLGPDRVSPRPPAPEDRRAARAAAGQGADHDGGGAREARGEPRRGRRHAAPAGCDLHRRPEEGSAGGPRGAAAEPAGDRARRHELRPRRGPVRDPGQRRRDPVVLADRARARRRDRRGPGEGDREGLRGRRGCRRSAAEAAAAEAREAADEEPAPAGDAAAESSAPDPTADPRRPSPPATRRLRPPGAGASTRSKGSAQPRRRSSAKPP